MRALLFGCVLALAPAFASGHDFIKNAQSGHRTQMHSYSNWDENCASKSGVVKVLVKPMNGTLSNEAKAGTIRRSPLTGRDRPCMGERVSTLRVYYTSARGFRGVDRFQIEVTGWRGKYRIDHFTVSVR